MYLHVKNAGDSSQFVPVLACAHNGGLMAWKCVISFSQIQTLRLSDAESCLSPPSVPFHLPHTALCTRGPFYSCWVRVVVISLLLCGSLPFAGLLFHFLFSSPSPRDGAYYKKDVTLQRISTQFSTSVGSPRSVALQFFRQWDVSV